MFAIFGKTKTLNYQKELSIYYIMPMQSRSTSFADNENSLEIFCFRFLMISIGCFDALNSAKETNFAAFQRFPNLSNLNQISI